MLDKAKDRAKMPEGTSDVLDIRSLENDYATLKPILKKGLIILDVGCGTGAISRGIANVVGNDGLVVGIDNSEYLIMRGREKCRDVQNLQLIQADLFNYSTERKFDLIVSARLLQWLEDPKEALFKFKRLIKKGGRLSILDYNHTKLVWKPQPPGSMKKFYEKFLAWRTDAGMDNEMADHLAGYLKELQFGDINVIKADEIYERSDNDFYQRVGIWSKVAQTRGKQMVESGFISENFRLQVIHEYDKWVKEKAESMIMYLNDTRGTNYE